MSLGHVALTLLKNDIWQEWRARQSQFMRQLKQEPSQTYGSNIAHFLRESSQQFFSNSRKYCLLGNPLDELVVCSSVFYDKNWLFSFYLQLAEPSVCLALDA